MSELNEDSNIAIANNVAEHENTTNTEIPSPWSHLDPMFKCVKRNGETITFYCLLCVPKQKPISAYYSSPSNLRKHVEASTNYYILLIY
jgi:hypothetical protein